ncbi:hypothetical protein MMC31_000720 [Peltigera leucophlebia]|nr:hypothetical protein [Peltigera leucophlebia]
MASPFSKLQLSLAADHSDSDSGSDLSSSPSSCSTSSAFSPRHAFANPIHISSKSTLSPPSTTSSVFSISPATPIFPICSPSAICAYPSWPARDCLSSTSTPANSCGGNKNYCGSSYISDEDLLDLEELELYEGSRVPVGMFPGGLDGVLTNEISWEATRQPPVVLASTLVQQAQGGKRRRRSSPLKQKRPSKKLSPIKEGQE